MKRLRALLCILALAACTEKEEGDTSPPETRAPAFSSPEEAVAGIRRMLRDEDWTGLAGYYDLSGSELEREELESGNFFLERDTNAEAQPREVTRYRHPFPPAAELAGVYRTEAPDVVAIEMTVEIDQGEEMPAQRVVSWFKMRKADGGWRILPGAVTPQEQAGEKIR